jgi:hypothetical protein
VFITPLQNKVCLQSYVPFNVSLDRFRRGLRFPAHFQHWHISPTDRLFHHNVDLKMAEIGMEYVEKTGGFGSQCFGISTAKSSPILRPFLDLP